MATRQEYNDILQEVWGMGPLPQNILPSDTLSESEAAVASYAWLSTPGWANKDRGNVLDAMLRSGLKHESDLDDTLRAMLTTFTTPVRQDHANRIAAITARHAKQAINTRQLIKFLGIHAKFLLAMTACHPVMARVLLAGYLLNGDWSTVITDFVVNVDAIAQREADAQLRATHPATVVVDAAIAAVKGATTPAAAVTVTPPVVAQGKSATALIVDDFHHVAASNATTIKEETNTMPQQPAIAAALSAISTPMVTAIEAMLTSSGAAGVTLKDLANESIMRAAAAAELDELKRKSQKETDELMAQLRIAKAAAPVSVTLQAHSGTIPAGKMEMVEASTIFPELAGVNLKVPRWVWDAPHPDVPAKTEGYIFRKPMLVRALRALANGENLWLQGHTGSGKTTFIEQIAHALSWPVLRIALDAAIDRSELVGRTLLKPDGKGGTESEWLKGALERAIPNAYILLLDEMDAGHPNSLYTLQPILEGKGLTLLEDGGRIVPYHPMTRIVATGNTAGSGDESGLYPACRILSAATLDRFPEFIEVPYLTVEEESALIQGRAGSKKTVATKLAKFANEMRAAFTKGELPVSYSPRRSVAFARAVEDYKSMGLAINGASLTDEQVFDLALAGKLMQATPQEHRQRLTEIARTCLGATGEAPKL